jgi:D-Tyr-tRNA(Tyr) deacylase
VDGNLISTIGKGVLAFAAISKDDTMDDAVRSASRLLKMKLWEDEEGIKVSIIIMLSWMPIKYLYYPSVEEECTRYWRRSPMW